MKVTVASSYREGSIAAIAAELSRSGLLDTFFTTYSTKHEKSLRQVPIVGPRAAKLLRRRAFPGIAQNEIRTVATLSELLHVAARRSLSRHSDTSVRLMYWLKKRFDLQVSRAIRKRPSDVFIGMWGSSLQTFASAGPNCFKVLNFINSRPSFHNRYLRELAGLQSGHPEMVPPKVGDLVEREMELADLILVPSQFIATQMAEYTDKTAILPYGVDVKSFSREDDIHPTAPTILYVGQISHRKGVSTLLKAATKLSTVAFRLVGPIVSSDLLESLPPNVQYLGTPPHEDIPGIMCQASLFVIASIEDAYPLVTMEAMSMGLPVIVSRNCGTAELIRHRENGLLFAAGDTSELVAHIEAVLSNSELASKMAEIARTQARANLSWQQYGLRVIQEILKRHAATNTMPKQNQAGTRSVA